MTRKEAIKHLTNDWFKLRNGQVCVEYDHSDRFLEAVGMAISALREQEKLESKLRALESSGWISVEERLPGAEFMDKEIIVCKLNRFGGQLVYVTRFWGTNSALWNDITHWMPLPEPPEVG